MKPIVLIVSICLLIIFGFSIRNSINTFQSLNSGSSINDASMYAFDPELNNNKAFTDFESRVSAKIFSEKSTINNYSVWSVGLNLLITIATGLAALLTTISTIKKKSVSKSVATLVAVITFVSSLLSYSLSQVNSLKGDAENRKQKIIKIREEAESLKPGEVDAQLPLLNRKLDEEI